MNKEELIKISCELIAENLGKSTAGYYQDFYNRHSEEEIKISIRELLSEIIGPQKAKQKIKKLLNF